MRRSRTSTRDDIVAQTLARNRLGVPAVVFFVLAAAAPMTVVACGATTGWAVTGVKGIPIAYLAIAAVLAMFSVGYTAMSRRIVNSGAFYSYIAQGLGRAAGVAAAPSGHASTTKSPVSSTGAHCSTRGCAPPSSGDPTTTRNPRPTLRPPCRGPVSRGSDRPAQRSRWAARIPKAEDASATRADQQPAETSSAPASASSALA
ncbi:hypothetical protein GCM10022255_094860 [Dactylosporangium darangshiense]|uniref:Amino acid permease/ SLC12A domain-containing protein n=1 Tax=Dactylosporangium darangshiense TaxID=579108 RepID=A0ABP8DQB9_9ACTN